LTLQLTGFCSTSEHGFVAFGASWGWFWREVSSRSTSGVKFFSETAVCQKRAALALKLPAKKIGRLVYCAEHGVCGKLWQCFLHKVGEAEKTREADFSV
jgi:hypothetical protein